MKNTLPWLCSLALVCLLQTANAQDFSIFESPQSEPPISFSLFDDTQVAQEPVESFDFAVLDPCKVCNCEETGVCLCEDCTCPNCPRAKPDDPFYCSVCKKTHPFPHCQDKRPVITAKVSDNCPPCVRLKADTTHPALSGFRFVFVETNGPAPIVEWQGNGRKVYFEGWHGVEYFLSQYEYSQKPRQETAQRRPVYRPAAIRADVCCASHAIVQRWRVPHLPLTGLKTTS